MRNDGGRSRGGEAPLVGEETGGRANMTMEPLSYVLPRWRLVATLRRAGRYAPTAM
jgi:hypothetical protein